MWRTALFWLCLLLVLYNPAPAETRQRATRKPAVTESSSGQPAADQAAAKELSGMSIVGNDEVPKSLYIVPWKSSEIAAETSLNMMLNERAEPVDRDVFMRQLDFYEISTKK